MCRKDRSKIGQSTVPGPNTPFDQFSVLVALALTVLTFTAYWQVADSGFVNLDDDAYVEFAPMVNQGLRSASVVWAFTATHSNNWHPLTSLSHMVDCQMFGIRPGPMHLENVCWHAFNAILVFVVWRKLTQSPWRSALVAALFALHPLHVESVAWISERKDLLSTCFLLLSLYAYVQHVKETPRPAGSFGFTRAWGMALAFFGLAALSKPMVVTLPCLLLLLDFWPFRRLAPAIGISVWRLLLE